MDLGCGSGAVTGELARRAGGRVVALDRSFEALTPPAAWEGAERVCGEAARLPFADRSLDLVFSQFTLLWLDAPTAIAEVYRVLGTEGVFVALEPDYDGLIEYPPSIATRDLWTDALQRVGADPRIGRKLPGLLAAAGFTVRVDLLDQLAPPSPRRFEFLRGLPLDGRQQDLLDRIQTADATLPDPVRVVHLPVFLVTATK